MLSDVLALEGTFQFFSMVRLKIEYSGWHRDYFYMQNVDSTGKFSLSSYKVSGNITIAQVL